MITYQSTDGERALQWRDATRELVLVSATTIAAAEKPQSEGSISVTLTGKSLSTDLLLAATGSITISSLSDHEAVASHPMHVVPMRLDILSELPAIAVLGRDVGEPTELRLVVELRAHNPRTETTSVISCEYDSVRLDAQTPHALLDFQPSWRSAPNRD